MKILDTVALLSDIPEHHLIKGQVGTIVEQLDDNAYEVEFIDAKTGQTLSIETLGEKDLMVLHFELEKA